MATGGDSVDTGRRFATGVAVAAPLAVALVAARGVRAALVGGRGFADSRADPGGFPKTLSSPTGALRTLSRSPRRIVSTYLAADEILADLVGQGRVVGVSAYADDAGTSNCAGLYPASVARVRSDPEAVLALEPDLICVAGFTEVDALRLIDSIDLPVVLWSRFDSLADIFGQVSLLGAAVGAEARAEALVLGVRRQLAELDARLGSARRVRVLYLDPPAFSAGRGTLLDEVLARAGGLNVVAELGITGPCQLDPEAILAADPDVILLPSYGREGTARRALAAMSGSGELAAVRAGRVHEIPAAWMTTVSHHAARALDRIARLLHPAAFGG